MIPSQLQKSSSMSQVVRKEINILRNKRKIPTKKRTKNSFDILEKRSKEPRRRQVDVLQSLNNSIEITFTENIRMLVADYKLDDLKSS